MPPHVYIEDIAEHVGTEVTLKGWLYNKRSSGKIHFLQVRDGTGIIQAVAFVKDVSPEVFQRCEEATQESSIVVTGTVREDPRAPGGHELSITDVEIVQLAQDYPIALKEHGVGFLMENRHLWLRSRKPHATLRIRAEVIRACQDYLDDAGFIRFDTPILTPCAAEGTSNLFSTQYFDLGTAYLAQTGQLYAEAGAMAFGKVYCYGPTFRAEKSKTRRHLTEFWMVEPEVAYLTHEGNLELQENLVSYIVQRVLERRADDLETLGRDTTILENVLPPFPRITYDQALELIEEKGAEYDCPALPWGEDLGAPHETLLADQFDRPVFVTHYPTTAKAFYMEPEPGRPEVARCADLLAPEGYGEIIGGSERISDVKLLEDRLAEWGLNPDDYQWYLDLRRYGTVPHSGFGMGIERVTAWICGLPHLREVIPFPRMLYRIHP